MFWPWQSLIAREGHQPDRQWPEFIQGTKEPPQPAKPGSVPLVRPSRLSDAILTESTLSDGLGLKPGLLVRFATPARYFPRGTGQPFRRPDENWLTAHRQRRRLVLMDIARKVAYWNDIADYDLETARAVLVTSRWLYAVFMSQQAMEKALKAAFLALERGDEPPRTHNLSFLLDQVDIGEDPNEVRDLAVRLSAYYIEARYPSYKEKLSTLVGRDEAVVVVDRTQEAISWIRSHLK